MAKYRILLDEKSGEYRVEEKGYIFWSTITEPYQQYRVAMRFESIHKAKQEIYKRATAGAPPNRNKIIEEVNTESPLSSVYREGGII